MATITCSSHFNNTPFQPDKLLCEGDLSHQEDPERFEEAYSRNMGVPATNHLQAEVVVCHANIITNRFFVGK